MTLTFTVYGVAKAKGNMRAFMVTKKATGMKVPIVTEGNPKTKAWSQLVAEGASRAISELPADDRGVLQEGVRVSVAFWLPRPKKYQKRGLAAAHLTSPDIDKLLRGVLDALTNVLWRDDSQVVELLSSKHYADVDDAPHVDIRVESTAGCRPIAVPAAPLPLFENGSLFGVGR